MTGDIVPGARFWLAWKNCIEFVEVLGRETRNTWRVTPTTFLDGAHRSDRMPMYIVLNTDLYFDPQVACQGRAAALRDAPSYRERRRTGVT